MRETKRGATVRMLCIIGVSVLAAFLVPLAARAWLASPRPVEAPLMAAWSGATQISDNDLTGFSGEDGMNFYPALAVVSPTVGVAWSRSVGDEALGYYDPYYRKSSGNGEAATWGVQSNIHSTSPFTKETVRVDVAIDSDGGLHFVWVEQTVTPYSYTLYYSYDAAAPEQITQTNNVLATPAIAAHSNQAVHVVWAQGANSLKYVTKAIGSGSWGSGATISSSTSLLVQPDIAVDSTGKAHVVFSEGGADSSADVFYKNSNNWTTTLREVSSDAGNGGRSPAIAVYSGTVYVVWCEWIAATQQYVRFRQSTNGGGTWDSSARISGDALAANSDSPNWLRPVIAVDVNEKVHVAFNGAGAPSDPEDIFYVSKTKDGSWSSRQNITQSNDQNDTTPAIAAGGEYVHLIWAGPRILPSGDNWYEVLYLRSSIAGAENGVYLPVIMKSRR